MQQTRPGCCHRPAASLERWAHVALAVAVLGAVTSCSDTPELAAPELKPLYEDDCPPESEHCSTPLDPDPEVWYTVEPGLEHVEYAATLQDPGYALPSNTPTWNGETYDIVPEELYVCPMTSPHAGFRAYKDGRWYSAPGYWVKVGGARPDRGTGGSPFPWLPHAFYAPPPGVPVLSDDLEYEFSGTFVVACQGGYVNGPHDFPVWRGALYTVGTRGTVDPVSGVGGGGGGSLGWAYGDASVNVESGVGSGWQQALDTYVFQNRCTPKWEIWVNGYQVCTGA